MKKAGHKLRVEAAVLGLVRLQANRGVDSLAVTIG